MRDYITDPVAIEEKSMLIIDQILGDKKAKFSSLEIPLLKRVIHTTADFEYADLLAFSPGAIEAGLAHMQEGSRVIVADTNMIAAGVNKKLLAGFDSSVQCFVALEETRQEAAANGLTRSMVNIRRAVEKYPRAIFAIGNAPTALYELLRLVGEQKAAPALVIGVPVGFVEAEESKEELIKSKLPYISVRGRKGGSTVAVAIINALLRMAAQGGV